MKVVSFPPGVKADEQVILFDGVCRLCNGWSRFIISFDKRHKFKLCSVQSEQGQAILKWFGYSTDNYETMLLIVGDCAFEKTEAFITIMTQLPFPWSAAFCLRVIPNFWRDWIYDRIALNRYRLFGRYQTCILPTSDIEARFLK